MSDTDQELARTMAEVQYRHSKAVEELATGRVSDADYHLYCAFMVLGDYIIEADEWTVNEVTDQEDDQ